LTLGFAASNDRKLFNLFALDELTTRGYILPVGDGIPHKHFILPFDAYFPRKAPKQCTNAMQGAIEAHPQLLAKAKT